MRLLSTLLSRARDLWTALLRLLGRDPEAPAALAAPPAAPAPPPPLAAGPAPVVLAEAPAARSDMSQSAALANVETAAARSDMSQRTPEQPAVEQGPPASASAAVIAAPRGPAVLASAPAVVTVRQFFARVAAAAPGGLSVDFATWQTAKVERFFMAMGAPDRVQRRGPALAEEVALDRAFDGFQWD